MSVLPVMEHFYTIQGEGNFTGSAAYFIRLGGCDVGCTWCDVKESWDQNNHPTIAIDQIVSFVVEAKANLAVITGGEPTMHSLSLDVRSNSCTPHENDFRWAENHAAKITNPNCKLLLQPEWDAQSNILPAIIDYVKAHPKWGISLQTHKWMNIP